MEHQYSGITGHTVLQVRWEYYEKMQDFEGNLAGQIDLDQDNAAIIVKHILHTALDNLISLQA